MSPLNLGLILVVGALSIALAYVMFQDEPKVDVVETGLKTGYFTQNLKGDTVKTWITWRIPQDERTFHIHIQNSPELTDERAKAIYDVIMSEETLEIDDSFIGKGPKGSSSTYYLGWRGAVNSINDQTLFPIPKTIHFHITDIGDGDVVMHLSKLVNQDGFSGVTKSIVDEYNNQIVKSEITVYDIDKLSINQLQSIVRHELGHAFGLAHSTASEDLMHATLVTSFPYISDCDLDALKELYNGSKESTVICEK